MIFPIDVHKRIADKRRLAGDNLYQLIATLFIVGNLILFFFSRWVSNMIFEGSFFGSTFFQIGVNVLIGIFVFRFLIFDENAKIKEYKASDNDSFAKFVRVRKNVSKVLKVHNHEISVIEFDDGSVSSTIEFKFGSNDSDKSRATQRIFQEIYKTAFLYGFEVRTAILPEDFTISEEFNNYTKNINKIASKKLKQAMTTASGAVINYSERNSNVNSIYLTVRSLNNSSRADLETLLSKIFSIVYGNYSAFRSVSFLNMKKLLEFYRMFYGIAAIDLQMMKVIDSSEAVNNSYNKIVKVYGLIDSDGKFYTSKDGRNIFNVEGGNS